MKYSILINTCDKFEDCWDPFFKLWSIYWPDCKGRIFLNTEYKDYSYTGLNITPVKGCVGKRFKGKYAPWSLCLHWALESIDTDIVLYMQEDYFLKDYVKNDIIESYVDLMHKNPMIKCIHLTDQAVGAQGKSEYDNLNVVKTKQRYRISCQAALWRKDELLSVIRDYENAWEFEGFGSQRSAIMNHLYLVVNRDWVKLDKFEIIPYIFTGIVQGRWKEQVVPLFKKHNIEIDYSKRGFLKDAPRKPISKKIEYHLRKYSIMVRHKVDLFFLKKSLLHSEKL